MARVFHLINLKWQDPRISIAPLVVAALLWPQQGRASDPIARPITRPITRIVSSVNAVTTGPSFSAIRIRQKCAADVMCAARFIAQKLGPKARLEKVQHPDTDTIRRVKNRASLKSWKLLSGPVLHIKLDHFGRKTLREITKALRIASQQTRGMALQSIEIDLRGNTGGRFDRMLKLAASFTGPVRAAIVLTSKRRTQKRPLPQVSKRFEFETIRLLVGPDTASSAEIFAALLRVHANAQIHGTRTYGKNYLLRLISINHDWRLLVPSQTIGVPGTLIEGGLVPDKKQRQKKLPKAMTPSVLSNQAGSTSKFRCWRQ